MKATIYIPDDKAKLYEEAKEKLSDSISETFVRCLETALETRRILTDRIVVEVRDPETDRFSKKAFEGVWLIGSDVRGEEHNVDEAKTGIRGGGDYAVARTKKGGIVVAEFNRDRMIEQLSIFGNFEEFSHSEIDNRYPQFPESLIAAVASELGEERIEELDI